MDVLETIIKRRTVRVPFSGRSVPEDSIRLFREVSAISPCGDPMSWRILRVDDEAKPALARIVKEEFGELFQKSSRRFRQVFSKYPRWLRFSDAQDGIRLVGMPKAAQYFYRLALGRQLGPMFGKWGIMNAEIRSYCRNIVQNPAVFGVFLDRHARSAEFAPIINAGGMLQNLRLTATALGLCYQDLGWITATKSASDRARDLLGVDDDYAAINFFRIGYADDRSRSDKKSDFRRDLTEIVHVERFGNRGFQGRVTTTTDVGLHDAIRGRGAKGESRRISEEEMAYLLEAGRWAPTGFNVQPFEYIISERDRSAAILVLENRERRDPDPGPCEALARGGVLQNIRLALRALKLEFTVRKPAIDEEEALRKLYSVPRTHSVVGVAEVC